MKIGDLVSVKGRYCVALYVSKKDIKNGTMVKAPGIYLFRGFWYGKNPFNIKCYGKIEGNQGKVVGRAKKFSQVKKLVD